MNEPLITKDRPWRARISLVNGETTNAIYKGDLVCLDPENPGKGKLPSSIGAAAHQLFAGIAVSTAQPGQPIDVVCGGYVLEAKLVNRKRSASTDSYASIPSRPVGAILKLDESADVNAFAYSAAPGANTNVPIAVLMESTPSHASMASNTNDSSLAQFGKVKVLLRALG